MLLNFAKAGLKTFWNQFEIAFIIKNSFRLITFNLAYGNGIVIKENANQISHIEGE